MIKVTLSKDKKKLLIEADIETPRPSGSGKTLVIATTGRPMKTDVMFQDRPITIGFNAYIPKDTSGAAAPASE